MLINSNQDQIIQDMKNLINQNIDKLYMQKKLSSRAGREDKVNLLY